MRIAAIHLRGFRNLDGRVPLSGDLAIVVGENNTGKSNLVDACRLLFDAEAGPRSRPWITERDFAHDGAGTPVADSFELEAELADLDEGEQARMVTCLAPSLGVGSARLRLRARLRADGRADTEWFGGDSDHPEVERWAREAVSFTYLHPLRDAASDLRPGRDNRLVGLLSALAPADHDDRRAVEAIIKQANEALREVSAIRDAKSRIEDRLLGLTGRGGLSQRTDLVFADPQFSRIVAALRAMAGRIEPLELAENGLGYNNLLYMAVLLSALSEQTDASLRVLLVEEPEAHLHPQLQDLLMRYLEEQSGGATQVIVTSHSPTFASAASVERLTVLTRAVSTDPIVARTPSDFGLTTSQLGHLRRFLDVTKASLLFARAVLLVEGVAEQLLLPALAKQLGRPLPRSGVTVINIGGVAFPPFADLFGAEKLPYRCAIVSDSDPRKPKDADADTDGQADTDADIDGQTDADANGNADADADADEEDPALSPVAARLLERESENVRVRLATNTLEWDLAHEADNWALLLDALTPIKPRVAARLRKKHSDEDLDTRADKFLDAVKDRKGRFAQELVALLEDGRDLAVPAYLVEAIEWVTPDQTPQQERMTDPLREPGFLTEHQLRAVHPERDIFLTACPGSGKTRAAGVRVARLDDEGRRVAACSYTNVGVEQLRRVINVDLQYALDSRQFVGTLHAFLLRYVLYPFGHLATGSTKTPRLFGEDFNWRAVIFNDNLGIRLSIDAFHFRPDGSLCVRSTPPKFSLSPEKAVEHGQTEALRLKRQAARAGMVSFDDAMYWALKVLENHPALAAGVASRFDELLVDEAQDTSELQLACLTALIDTGKLDSLVLVGDLEQSISAYTGASRTGCEALAQTRGLTDVGFTQNHRSSQRICNVAFHFCSRDTPDEAVGPDAEWPWAPEILLYDPGDPRASVERFRQRLAELEHDHAEAAVLARGNALVDELNGQTTAVKILPRPLAVARAVSAVRGASTLGRREIEAVDRIIAYMAADISDLSELTPRQRWACRQASMELLRRAPSLDTDLREWIRDTAVILGEIVARIARKPTHKAGLVLQSAAKQEGHVTREIVKPRAKLLRAQTVHDIKGESRGAVLVVVDRLRSRKRAAQGALWSQPLRGETVSEADAEELRIAFVALTRARRYCALALPDDGDFDVIDAYLGAGFERA